MPDFDNAWKEALEVFFEPFMAFFFADAHREIDWAHGFEMLDKELQQITLEAEHGRRVADKLVKVWRTNGRDEWVLVHVEVQSQHDRDFAERMFVYNYRLFDRYNRRVASFAILGDNRPAWRPRHFGYELWGTKIGIEFGTAKLLDYGADEVALESHPNPFATVVLAHLKTLAFAHDDEARRASQVRLVKGLYERGFSAEQIRQLYRLMEGMMDLPARLSLLAWEEIRDFAKEKNMSFVTGAERFGRQEGLAEGRAQGLAEAREHLLAGIEAVLDIKFAAAGLALLPEIRQVNDLELLRKILQAAKQADAPESVRGLWSNAGK
ncbi:MAG TPA: hypothetical protein VF306_00905 [Pirellulales bacterium]